MASFANHWIMAQTKRPIGFGDRVAQERRIKSVVEWRDLEKQEIAKALKVDNATVGRWERGTIPDDTMLVRVAEYYGVTPAYLRYGHGPRRAGGLAPESEPEDFGFPPATGLKKRQG